MSKTHTKKVGVRNCWVLKIIYMLDRIYLTTKFNELIMVKGLLKINLNPL
jgi:hypothetical protein